MTLIANELKTARLVLRPYRYEDVDDILEFSTNPDWSRFLPVPQPYTREDATRYIQEFIEMPHAEGKGFAITLKGKVIGGVRIRLFLNNHRAEIGYSISPAHWRNGFAFEAVHTVINACFESIADLNRISANADFRNNSSRELLKKIGLKEEGILRQNRFKHGQPIDEVWYGILRSEWYRSL
jgi:ribosomal-protein-alanine N-acetyltransferase